MKKYNLRCFKRGCSFVSKEEVFRDYNDNPICQNCLIEYLEETWAYDFAEYIFGEIKNRFNRNYLKWKKWFYENHVLCDGDDHDEYSFYYEEKDKIKRIDEKNYCRECMDVFSEGNLI